jgi:phage shock protein A
MSVADRIRAWLGRRPASSRASGAAGASEALIPAAAAAAAEAEYQEQLQALERVRRSSAEVLVTRKKLEAQAQHLRRTLDDLEATARAEAAEGRDDQARAALTQALQLERQLADRRKTIDDLRARERDLQESSGRLQGHIEDYRVRLEAARARHGAAEACGRAEQASAEARRPKSGDPEP